MKKMLDWLTRFIWVSEVIFLAASTPHIATYYAHFDNPTDFVGTIYAWGVGYGLALLIDGVSFVVLMSMMFSVKYRRPGWLIGILIGALILISTLSWYINWQYDIVFSSTTFANADKIVVWSGVTVGSLNPIIGGAFPFLSILYAFVAKAIEVDDEQVNKSAMSPEAFEMEKIRIAQEQELRTLRSAGRSGKGLLSIAKDSVMGKSSDPEALLNRVLSYLQDARDLVPVEQEERALDILVAHLETKPKIVLPLLVQARSIIEREEEQERNRLLIEEEARRNIALIEEQQERERVAREEEARRNRALIEEEERRNRQLRIEEEERLALIAAEKEERIERLRLEHEAAMAKLQAEKEEREHLERIALEQHKRQAKETNGRSVRQPKERTTEVKSLDGLKGDDTVTLEEAAQMLGYDDTRYVARLCTQGKLKHRPNREDLITVASLRAYLATHKRRTPTTDKLKAQSSNGHAKETIKLDEFPDILV